MNSTAVGALAFLPEKWRGASAFANWPGLFTIYRHVRRLWRGPLFRSVLPCCTHALVVPAVPSLLCNLIRTSSSTTSPYIFRKGALSKVRARATDGLGVEGIQKI